MDLVNLSNIVISDVLHNHAVWDFSKTPTLPEILNTQNRLRAEYCGSFAVTLLFCKLDV